MQYRAPIAWTTLALTIHADGRVRARAGRRQPVPAPLGVRRRRHAGRQERADRLQAAGTATPSASTRRGATLDSPALVTAVETALERELSTHDHARRREAEDPQAQGAATRSSPGRAGDERVPAARRCARASTSTATSSAELGPGRGARRAGHARRRQAHVDAAGRHAVQGRRGVRRAPSTADAAGTELSQGHRREVRGGRRRLTCGSTSAGSGARRRRPGAEFAGVGGHTSCVAIAHDGRSRRRSCSTPGTGLRAARRRCSTAQPFRGTILLGHLHWDHTQGCRSSAPATATTPRSRAAACPSRAPSRVAPIAASAG